MIYFFLACFFSVGYSKYSEYSEYSKNTQYQDIGGHIYLTKYFFREIISQEIRSLEKKFMIKKYLKNTLFSNCDL